MSFPGPINLDSKVALYQQIENFLQSAIASCELKPGSKLPSVRDLSGLYAVTPNTIAKVYRDLEVVGVLLSKRGEGVFVREGATEKCQLRCLERMLAQVYLAAQEANVAKLPLARHITM